MSTKAASRKAGIFAAASGHEPVSVAGSAITKIAMTSHDRARRTTSARMVPTRCSAVSTSGCAAMSSATTPSRIISTIERVSLSVEISS